MRKLLIAALVLLCIAADELHKYKVTLTKSDKSTNRTVYVDAPNSGDARKTAEDQNPGWKVLTVTEVKEKKK